MCTALMASSSTECDVSLGMHEFEGSCWFSLKLEEKTREQAKHSCRSAAVRSSPESLELLLFESESELSSLECSLWSSSGSVSGSVKLLACMDMHLLGGTLSFTTTPVYVRVVAEALSQAAGVGIWGSGTASC